jgi:hypothetical protein
MAYTPATKYPSNTVLTVFTWSRPTDPNPRMAQPGNSTQTTLYFSSAPKDRDGNVITSGFLMGIKSDNGSVETVYVPAGALDTAGTTATGVVRGIRPEGLDYTTGDAAFAADFRADAPIFCNIAQVYHRMMIGALNGTIASGGTTFKVGDGTDSDVQVIVYNADTNKPYFGYDKTTNQFIYSNDGVSSTPFGTGAGVTGGDGITVTAGDIDVDLSDTVIFKSTSAGASDSGKVPRLNGSGVLDTSFIDSLSPVNLVQIPTTVGEDINGTTTPQLVFISDGTNSKTAGRSYKADADDTTNMAMGAVGFITSNTTTGNTTVIKQGYVTGFTGLTAGALYYSSTTAGSITATASNQLQIPVAIALSTTTIYTLPISYKPQRGSTTSVPAISGTTSITINTGYKAKFIQFFLGIQHSDGGGGNGRYWTFNGLYDGTTWSGNFINVTAATGTIASSTFLTTAPVSTSAGGANTSSITLSTTFNATNTVLTLTNAITAGTGSNNMLLSLSAIVFPY